MISGGAIMDSGVKIPKSLTGVKVKPGGGSGQPVVGGEIGGDKVTISKGAKGKKAKINPLVQLWASALALLTGDKSTQETDGSNGGHSGEENQEGGENTKGQGLLGLKVGNYYVDTSHLMFFKLYLDSMERICEKLGKMFETPKDVKKAEEAWIKKVEAKKAALGKLIIKIEAARAEAKDVVNLAGRVRTLLARLNNNPSNPKAAAAAVVEALSELSGKLGNLVFLSAQIDKDISALPLLETDKNNLGQLKTVSAKLKKTIKTYSKIYEKLSKQLQLAGA